jgi:hypothetical protein
VCKLLLKFSCSSVLPTENFVFVCFAVLQVVHSSIHTGTQNPVLELVRTPLTSSGRRLRDRSVPSLFYIPWHAPYTPPKIQAQATHFSGRISKEPG